MWQRVQTLYLGIATAVIAALFGCNAASIALPDGQVDNIRYIDKTVYLVWLILLTVLGTSGE